MRPKSSGSPATVTTGPGPTSMATATRCRDRGDRCRPLLHNQRGERFLDVTATSGQERSKAAALPWRSETSTATERPTLYMGDGASTRDAVVAFTRGEEDEPPLRLLRERRRQGIRLRMTPGREPTLELYHNGEVLAAEACAAAQGTALPGRPRMPGGACGDSGAADRTRIRDLAGSGPEDLLAPRWSGAGDHHLSGIVRGGQAPQLVEATTAGLGRWATLHTQRRSLRGGRRPGSGTARTRRRRLGPTSTTTAGSISTSSTEGSRAKVDASGSI